MCSFSTTPGLPWEICSSQGVDLQQNVHLVFVHDQHAVDQITAILSPKIFPSSCMSTKKEARHHQTCLLQQTVRFLKSYFCSKTLNFPDFRCNLIQNQKLCSPHCVAVQIKMCHWRQGASSVSLIKWVNVTTLISSGEILLFGRLVKRIGFAAETSLQISVAWRGTVLDIK